MLALYYVFTHPFRGDRDTSVMASKAAEPPSYPDVSNLNTETGIRSRWSESRTADASRHPRTTSATDRGRTLHSTRSRHAHHVFPSPPPAPPPSISSPINSATSLPDAVRDPKRSFQPNTTSSSRSRKKKGTRTWRGVRDPYKDPAMWSFWEHWVLWDVWTGIAFQVMLATAVVLTIQWFPAAPIALSAVLLTVLGNVLSFVLAFRTSSANERYIEGRRHWVEITTASRSFARLVWFHTPTFQVDGEEGAEKEENIVKAIVEKKTIINLVAAYAIASKHYLRGENGVFFEDLWPLVCFTPKYSFRAVARVRREDLGKIYRAPGNVSSDSETTSGAGGSPYHTTRARSPPPPSSLRIGEDQPRNPYARLLTTSGDDTDDLSTLESVPMPAWRRNESDAVPRLYENHLRRGRTGTARPRNSMDDVVGDPVPSTEVTTDVLFPSPDEPRPSSRPTSPTSPATTETLERDDGRRNMKRPATPLQSIQHGGAQPHRERRSLSASIPAGPGSREHPASPEPSVDKGNSSGIPAVVSRSLPISNQHGRSSVRFKNRQDAYASMMSQTTNNSARTSTDGTKESSPHSHQRRPSVTFATSKLQNAAIQARQSRRDESARSSGDEKRFDAMNPPVPLLPPSNPPPFSITEVLPILITLKKLWNAVRTKLTNGKCRRCEFGSGKEKSHLQREHDYHNENVPLHITLYLSNWVASLQRRKALDVPTATALLANLQLLTDSLTDLERILTTPIPFGYQLHLRYTCFIFLFLLPFEIADSFGMFTIPIVAFVSYIFLGFLHLGSSIENPFDYKPDGIELDVICHDIIAAELREITSVPPPDIASSIFTKNNVPFFPFDTRSAIDLISGKVGLSELKTTMKAGTLTGKHEKRRVVLGKPGGKAPREE